MTRRFSMNYTKAALAAALILALATGCARTPTETMGTENSASPGTAESAGSNAESAAEPRPSPTTARRNA